MRILITILEGEGEVVLAKKDGSEIASSQLMSIGNYAEIDLSDPAICLVASRPEPNLIEVA